MRSLLNAVGDVHETHKGHVVVTIGSDTETFEPPRTKDLDAEQLSNLRRLLRRAGYGPEGTAGDGPEGTAGDGPEGTAEQGPEGTAGEGPEEMPA